MFIKIIFSNYYIIFVALVIAIILIIYTEYENSDDLKLLFETYFLSLIHHPRGKFFNFKVECF